MSEVDKAAGRAGADGRRQGHHHDHDETDDGRPAAWKRELRSAGG
jgi:hypothetical protein